MVRKKTLELKKEICPKCKNANKTKLRNHHSDYCTRFRPRNSECANFTNIKISGRKK